VIEPQEFGASDVAGGCHKVHAHGSELQKAVPPAGDTAQGWQEPDSDTWAFTYFCRHWLLSVALKAAQIALRLASILLTASHQLMSMTPSRLLSEKLPLGPAARPWA
jgi:hypothetical protein